MSSEKVAVNAVIDFDDDNEAVAGKVTCSSGVIFETKAVSLGLLQDINKIYNKRKPKVPVYVNRQKGRQEENPDDPDYIADKQAWQNELLFAQMDALLLKGTRVVFLPEAILPHTDDEWLEEYDILGVDIDRRERGRYLAWVKYIAAPAPNDIKLLTENIGKKTGVSEEEVAQAVDRFRSESA